MDAWAIVIGINQYWRPEACLKGAVQEAIRVADWLVKSGGVSPRQLFLLLEPTPADNPALAAFPNRLPATHDSIVEAIERHLMQRSGGAGDRFYFYYSGHGLSATRDFTLHNGIIPTDFTQTLTNKAISLRSIYDRFLATQFKEQFFFIDACRNIPFDFPFRISDLDRPGEPVPPYPSQFIMYATSSGVKAAEIGVVGDERAAFTGALLEGLAGKGTAKVFDDNEQQYLVTWDSLFNYVEADVKQRKIGVGGSLIQEPKKGGEHGSENPVLAKFALGSFGPEHLEVKLVPSEAAAGAEVVVSHIGGEVDRKPGLPDKAVLFNLEPRTYSLRWSAKNFKPAKAYEVVPLYTPRALDLQLQPQAANSLAAERPVTTRGDGGQSLPAGAKGVDAYDDDNERGIEDSDLSYDAGYYDENAPGQVEVIASDSLAHLVLLDNTGTRIVAQAIGYLFVSQVPPGFYRARLLAPEGDYSERLLELAPGEMESFSLQAPPLPDTPLFGKLMKKGNFYLAPDNTVHLSEAIGLTASPRLSTVLALAAGAASEKTNFGYRLRQLGIPSFQQSAAAGGDAAPVTSGIQILFGVEAGDRRAGKSYLTRTRLAVWSQSSQALQGEQSPTLIPGMPGLAEFSYHLEPRAYWLSLHTPDQGTVTLATPVLSGRLALVIFTRSQSGEYEIFQYRPGLAAQDPMDSRSGMARFPALQRSEMIQRAYQHGRLDLTDKNVLSLFEGEWVEPVAAAICGMSILKFNPKDPLLKQALKHKQRFFGGLSDADILEGAYLEAQAPLQPEKVAQAYLRALDAGIPLLAESLGLLVNAADRLHFDHPHLDHFRQCATKRIRGLVWSAVAGKA